MASQWFYQVMGEEVGPISSAELRNLAQRGAVKQDTPVRNRPDQIWVPAERVQGLFAVSNLAPPPPSPVNPAPIPQTACGVISTVQSTQVRPCPFCGEEILVVAKKCKHCGEFFDSSTPCNATQTAESDKRILPLLLLFWFFGGIGGHAFYAGRELWGLFYLSALPLGLVGVVAVNNVDSNTPLLLPLLMSLLPVWAVCLVADLIRINSGVYKDGNGRRISKWT